MPREQGTRRTRAVGGWRETIAGSATRLSKLEFFGYLVRNPLHFISIRSPPLRGENVPRRDVSRAPAWARGVPCHRGTSLRR